MRVPKHKDNAYFMFHRRRYQWVVDLVNKLELEPDARCLDVGQSDLTGLLEMALTCPVDTLGLEPDRRAPARRHYQLDLNRCQRVKDCRRDLGPYSLIVMAEVIEHLYTSPFLVLAYLRSLLRPGGRLIVQTPNAAALENRLKLLCGSNPYPLIELSRRGHYRELTAKELRQYAAELEMRVESVTLHRYFDARYRKRLIDGQLQHAPPNWLSYVASASAQLTALIPGFRPGLTAILRKQA